VRTRLLDGDRHERERRMKERRRSAGRRHHEAVPVEGG
jgi:hypothetical protein